MTSSPRETELCQYHYDALDRLISHALADTPWRQRFYCKSRLTTEIQGAMRYSIVQQDDQLLAQQRSEGDAPDTTLLATDQQRSVLQTVKANQLPQPIAYSPYGHRSAESGLLSLLGFNGERPDPVTGCYLLGNGYRAFNPVLMRFNSPDSWSPFGRGGLNAYAYCAGDPICRADPTGHGFIKNLVNTSSIPLSKNTIDALRNTRTRMGGEAKLLEVAATKRRSPQQILVKKTIKNQMDDIDIEFGYIEQPGFKITDIETISTIHLKTTETVSNKTNILRELRYGYKYLLHEQSFNKTNDKLDRANQFLNDEAFRVTEARIARFNRDKVINYTRGEPPHYDEYLFPSTNIPPSTSNHHVRRK